MGLPAASLAFSIIGTGVGAIQSAQQQSAANARYTAQANYNAAIANNNAIAARQDAAAIRERGEIAEADRRRRVIQVKGAAKARQAALGFLLDDTEDSTNVQLIADLAEQGELDVLRIRDNTEMEARRALIQASNYQSQAQFDIWEGQSAQGSPLLAGTSTLLGGAGDVFSAASKIKKWQ